MMAILEKLIVHIELHDAGSINQCFNEGINPNEIYQGKPLIYELISEYTRSARFKNCVKVFVDHGLLFEDKILLSVLLNDAEKLDQLLGKNPLLVNKKYSLPCAYSPIFECSLLHICAEFDHRDCAEVLVKYGIDINNRAGIDAEGFGGQTAIFHTVNQNSNESHNMLDFLLLQKADLKLTVPGLVWGKGYAWETLIPSVNPISYAMMGLLPQMHRDELIISGIVNLLLKHGNRIDYTLKNVPNKYLTQKDQ